METKVLPLREAKIDPSGPGRLSGYASVFGQVDSVGDTIVKGAYRDTLPAFLRDGFIAWSHDWGRPVATPEVAREDARGLWIEADFHTDAEAQRVRALVAERVERGKSMGLSIGYEAKRYDHVVMDGQQVRRLLEIGLLEVSLVMVPADTHARVSNVKRAGAAAGAPRRPVDPALAAIFRQVEAWRQADVAEARAILARIGEKRARERRVALELQADIARTLVMADRILGPRGTR